MELLPSYVSDRHTNTYYMYEQEYIIVRMAKAAKRLQAILDYMKKVKSSTSIVFGQFS